MISYYLVASVAAQIPTRCNINITTLNVIIWSSWCYDMLMWQHYFAVIYDTHWPIQYNMVSLTAREGVKPVVNNPVECYIETLTITPWKHRFRTAVQKPPYVNSLLTNYWTYLFNYICCTMLWCIWHDIGTAPTRPRFKNDLATAYNYIISMVVIYTWTMPYFWIYSYNWTTKYFLIYRWYIYIVRMSSCAAYMNQYISHVVL